MPWVFVASLVVLCKIIAGEIIQQISEGFSGFQSNDGKFNAVALHIQPRAVLKSDKYAEQFSKKFDLLAERHLQVTNVVLDVAMVVAWKLVWLIWREVNSLKQQLLVS